MKKVSLVEARIPGSAIEKEKLDKRIRDLSRLSTQARVSASKALSQGKEELANKLNEKADEIDELIDKVYQDSLDDESTQENGAGGEEGGEKENNGQSEANDKQEKDNKNGEEGSEGEGEDDDEESETSDKDGKDSGEEDIPKENKENPQKSPDRVGGNDSGSGNDSAGTGSDSDSNSSQSNDGENEGEDDSSDDGDSAGGEGDESDDDGSDEGDSEDGSDEGDSEDGDDEDSDDGQDGDSDGDDQEGDDESEGDDDGEDDEGDDADNSSGKSGGKKGSKGQKGSSGDSSDSEDEDDDDDGEDESDDDEDESDDDDDEDDPVEDPFADEEDIPTGLSGMGGKEPRQATLDDIIKILKQLSGESKRGAIDGIKDLLSKKDDSANESLTEAARKNLGELSDDEYGDLVNDTIELIQQVDEIEPIRDIDDRIAKINQIANDPKTAKAIKQDDNMELQKDYQAKKARESENDKYRNYPTLEQFELDFYETINEQVALVKQNLQTYDEINSEYEGENIVLKADVVREIPEEDKPVIDFYFDCSGSWTGHPDAIEIGKRAVATVKEFEDRDEIKLNVYYFGDNISTDMKATGVWGGGTSAWNEILQNIKATEATNVVLMTDCDMSSLAKRGPTCVVDGCVWFIWSLYDYTRGSNQIVKHLKGMQGQYQCAFGEGGKYNPSEWGD